MYNLWCLIWTTECNILNVATSTSTLEYIHSGSVSTILCGFSVLALLPPMDSIYDDIFRINNPSKAMLERAWQNTLEVKALIYTECWHAHEAPMQMLVITILIIKLGPSWVMIPWGTHGVNCKVLMVGNSWWNIYKDVLRMSTYLT